MLQRDLRREELSRVMLAGVKLRVGILIVATGRYAVYVAPLLADCARHFLQSHERTVFVFSDAKPEAQAALRIVHVPTAHAPWPMPTLMRNHYFCGASSLLRTCDVLYYLDADTRVIDDIDEAVLPEEGHDLVAVQHPGFCGAYSGDGRLARSLRALGLPWRERRWIPGPRRGTYETNPLSTAYVAPHEGSVYFMGGFYGGRTPAFLEMAERIRDNVDRDLHQGITAVWHDESHLNRYLIDHPPKQLSPSYGFPERWGLPFHPRILLLDKDHAAMRAPLSSAENPR